MSDLKDSAMANMSRYIGRLENQLTSEQLSIASNGAAAPLLNARDQYNRAERWKYIAEVLEQQQAMPDQHLDNLIALARALEKD
jgi:hypothetical protein